MFFKLVAQGPAFPDGPGAAADHTAHDRRAGPHAHYRQIEGVCARCHPPFLDNAFVSKMFLLAYTGQHIPGSVVVRFLCSDAIFVAERLGLAADVV